MLVDFGALSVGDRFLFGGLLWAKVEPRMVNGMLVNFVRDDGIGWSIPEQLVKKL